MASPIGVANRDEMIARIAAEIRRPALATGGQILNAINDAIGYYQRERFRFNEVGAVPVFFDTVIGQSIYGAAANNNIATMPYIDWVNILIGSTTEQLERVQPEEIYLMLQQNTQSGQPTSWAYDQNSIILYPQPSGVYRINVGGVFLLPGPTLGADRTNSWMNEAAQLIRCRAKYEIAVHVTRDDKMAARFSPEPPGETWRAWRNLKGESNRATGTGRIRSMRF